MSSLTTSLHELLRVTTCSAQWQTNMQLLFCVVEIYSHKIFRLNFLVFLTANADRRP